MGQGAAVASAGGGCEFSGDMAAVPDEDYKVRLAGLRGWDVVRSTRVE